MIDQKHAVFIEGLPWAAGFFSSDGTLQKSNGRFHALFGVTLPALVDGRYNILRDDLVAKSLRPGEELAPVFAGKTMLSAVIQYPLAQADRNLGLEKKELLVFEIIAYPLWSESPAASGVIVVFKDIGEQHKKQIQLAENEKRYRTLMEALPDMLFCVAPDQTLLFVNSYSARQFHITPEQMAGKKLSELFPKPMFERMWKNILQVFETGQPRYTENRTLFGENALWLDTWLVPLCDSQGAVYAIMGVSRDITEKMKYKEELEKTRNLESLGILAGGIAHDFNNILTAIQGNLSLLKETCASTADQADLFEQADKATDRAKALTQQLLTFSKGGAPVRLKAMIGELITDSTGFVVHGTAARSECAIQDGLWLCELDAGQISQVIQNLVINAVQAMPGGGVVRVAAENTELEKGHASGYAGRFVKIAVRDEGIGIPEENLEKVFVPFFTTKSTGNGLGLSICYSIVKNHDGFINVDSRPGKGTTVSVFLPALPEASGTGAAPERGAAAKKAKRGRRILVIDDEAFVRFTLEKCLLHLGCRPVLAADGGEGLGQFEKALRDGNPFEAVILDLTIPGGAGGNAILGDLLKADPHIKAVVSSGYANSPVLADPAAFGFKAVLKKPFSLADLEIVLDQVL
jgi:two-component system cell cycle sensor histidine kinase/response regulator CckA